MNLQEYASSEPLNQTIRLNDGRRLGYAEYGDLNGKPVMCFHGGNMSRYEGMWYADAAAERGIRLIIPDRPGFGISDFQAGRALLDWPDDVIALADSLGLERFGIFGISGAAPHVAAVAYKIPQRLTRVAIVSGAAPPVANDRFKGMWLPVRALFFFARYAPILKRFMLKQMASFYSDPEKMKTQMRRALPQPELDMMDNHPEKIDIFALTAREAHRNGLDGDAWEWHLYVHPWGFDVADIDLEVGLWYGRYDQQVPVAMGEYYARTLPRNFFHAVDDGGHLSTANNYIGEILDYLTS